MLIVKKDGALEEFSLDKMVASVPHIAKEEMGDVMITYVTSFISVLAILEDLKQRTWTQNVVQSTKLRELIIKELEDRGV